MMKADDSYLAMPMDSCMSMLPHRLFESTPEKTAPGAILDFGDHSSTSDAAAESGDSIRSAEVEATAPETPRSMQEKQDSVFPLMSPQPRMSPPTTLGLTTPTPATPKRQCYVPETPSPE